VTNEILQTLPSTRQRNSLLSVGMNLNIPDEDPKLLVNNSNGNSNSKDIPTYKKRFSISNYNNDEFESPQQQHQQQQQHQHVVVERENKIPRTSSKENSFLARSVPMECDDALMMTSRCDVPQNLTTNRRAANSLMDLSFACEKERRTMTSHPRHIPVAAPMMSSHSSSFSSLSSSFSFSSNSISSSNSSLNGVVASSPFVTRSITYPSTQPSKKPLQMSNVLNTNNVKLVHVGSNPNPTNNSAMNRCIGFGRSKTVIALVSPTSATSNCYPAVQTSPVSLVMKKSFN
jgi:hypothetical protein